MKNSNGDGDIFQALSLPPCGMKEKASCPDVRAARPTISRITLSIGQLDALRFFIVRLIISHSKRSFVKHCKEFPFAYLHIVRCRTTGTWLYGRVNHGNSLLSCTG